MIINFTLSLLCLSNLLIIFDMCLLDEVNQCRKALGLQQKTELDFLNEDGSNKNGFKRINGKVKA